MRHLLQSVTVITKWDVKAYEYESSSFILFFEALTETKKKNKKKNIVL